MAHQLFGRSAVHCLYGFPPFVEVEVETYSPVFEGIRKFEWTAEALVGTLEDGDPVENIPDVGQGAAFDSVQTISSSKPEFLESLDGYPGVGYDGGQDRTIADVTGLNSAGGLTLFLVSRLRNYSIYAGGVIGDTGEETRFDERLEIYATATGRRAVASNRYDAVENYQSGTTSYPYQAMEVLTVELWDGSRGLFSGRTVVDAVSSGSGTMAPDAFTRLIFGQGYNQTLGDWVLHACVIYEGQLSEAQVTSVWDSLALRFGEPL